MDEKANSETRADVRSIAGSAVDDDKQLLEIGYVPSFRREFTNLATISFAFSIMGLCASVAFTFNTPLLLGGPASVAWCWIVGTVMCLALGASIAEIVSAFPTCGGVYTASAQLVPRRHRPIVGWIVGWLTMFGQVVGLSSAEYGLASMIWAGVVVGQGDRFKITAGKNVGLLVGLLAVHGALNSVTTRTLARFTTSFMFVNLGATFLIIIILLAMTPRGEMHSASYVFGREGVINQTGGWNDGLAFLFGLLGVQWTMTNYDATGHISEEVKRAAYAAPTAIVIAVLGTGLIGWVLNIVVVLCSGPLEDLPGPSGSAFLEIMVLRMGKAGALTLWVLVCLTAFLAVQNGLQATSRACFAFSRDHGLPDRGYFGHVSSWTKTPLRAIWLITIAGVFPALLDFASVTALNAVFAMTAMALDMSYIIPIFCRRWYGNHPEVRFKPGPFYMGDGLLGCMVNVVSIVWTCFMCVVLAIPTLLPITAENMNYAGPISGAIILLSLAWYYIGGHRHYKGPQSNITHQPLEIHSGSEPAGGDSEKGRDEASMA